jgi:hypothetical protein
VSLTLIGVVGYCIFGFNWCCFSGGVVMLHLFVVLYFFSPFVYLILMVEFYNIFADSEKKNEERALK